MMAMKKPTNQNNKGALFNRRHYKPLAALMKAAKQDVKLCTNINDDEAIFALQVLQTYQTQLMDMLEADNPEFSRYHFIEEAATVKINRGR